MEGMIPIAIVVGALIAAYVLSSIEYEAEEEIDEFFKIEEDDR